MEDLFQSILVARFMRALEYLFRKHGLDCTKKGMEKQKLPVHVKTFAGMNLNYMK